MNLAVSNDPTAPTKLIDTRGRRISYIIRNSSGADFWIAEHRNFLQGTSVPDLVAKNGFLIGAADTSPTYFRNFKGEIYAISFAAGAAASIYSWEEHNDCECGS